MAAKQKMGGFISTSLYCLRLCWQSSPFYTALRLGGKFITPLFAIASSYALKSMIDTLTGSANTFNPAASVLGIIAVIAGINIVTALCRKAIDYAESMQNDMLQNTIMDGVMAKALDADIAMFDDAKTYDRFISVASDSYVVTHCLWSVIDFVSACVSFLYVAVILGFSNIFFALLVVATSFPSAIARTRYIKDLYLFNLGQVNQRRKQEYIYYVATHKEYAQDIRLFHIGGVLRGRYKALWQEMFLRKKKLIKKRTILTSLLELLPELVMAYVLISISFGVLAGVSTVGDYTFITGIMGQLIGSITLIIHNATNIIDNQQKIENVRRFDAIPKAIANTGTRTLSRVTHIAFEHVSFAYPGADKQVLRDVSFFLQDSEKLALVGVNGAGKTTIIKLLLRFYEVTGGRILINGHDIKEYELGSLHRCFSLYFQNAPNYGFTLRENVTLGDQQREAGEDEVYRALELASATKILDKAQGNLDAYLTRGFDENGIELSGGEHQKVALARMFYRQSSVAVLDEPSSSLDPEAEDRLFRRLGEFAGDKLAIFTSHRLSNVYMADRIIVLEDGAIIEDGTRSQLMDKGGRFSELYHFQSDKYKV